MHIILSSVGTDGDIFPFIGLGRVLRARGHRVTLTASAHYEALAVRQDLGFAPLISKEENDELFHHPDFWNPVRTAPLAARWGVRFLRRQFELLSNLAGPDAILVTNPAIFAAGLVHEKRNVPLVNLILQPWIIPSSVAPPVMPGLTFLQGAPPIVWKTFARLIDVMGDVLVGPELNRLRRSLGLPAARRILGNWFSRQLVLGLFPEWYGAPQSDWPKSIRLAHFPLFDGGQERDLPVAVQAFCATGTPPLAFTFGTGMAHPRELFRVALETCATLGMRGIFLTKYAEELPRPLSANILHSTFAPFAKLFPLCAAVVHHGGIGTVAQAFASGIPQLIRPLCFDQTDNGVRVDKLGVGTWIKPGRNDLEKMAASLRRLMTPDVAQRCKALSGRCPEGEGLARAADHIEKFAP